MATQPPPTAGMTITATPDRLFATIRELIGRDLTDAERSSLRTRLEGLNYAPVQPGDLITADLFNALRADVNDCFIRLAALEAGTALRPPIITGISPNPATAGETLTITGANLTPSTLTILRVGTVDIGQGQLLPPSSGSQLRFVAPGVIGLPAGGADVPVIVANAAGEARASLVLRPGAVTNLQANPVFRLLSRTGSGTSFTYRFELAITTGQAAILRLAPAITPRPGATGSFTATLVGPADLELPQSPSTPLLREFDVNVTIGTSGTADLGFTLTGVNFPTFTASSPLFEVSAAAPTPTRTDIVFGGLSVGNPATLARIAAGRLEVNQAALAATLPTINLILPITTLPDPDGSTYAFAVRFDPATTDWTVSVPTARASFTPTAAQPRPANFNLPVRPTGPNPGPATLVFTVTRDRPGFLPAELRVAVAAVNFS